MKVQEQACHTADRALCRGQTHAGCRIAPLGNRRRVHGIGWAPLSAHSGGGPDTFDLAQNASGEYKAWQSIRIASRRRADGLLVALVHVSTLAR
jgi:hypothetical protein